MSYATGGDGSLIPIQDCYISVPNAGIDITFNILPDISDQKSAEYSDEPIIGRSTPIKTYSHSAARAISMTVHFVVCKNEDIQQNLRYLRQLESLVYPGDGGSSTPYVPPLVAQVKCGKLLGEDPLCCILKSYSVKFPTEVAWDSVQGTYLPFKLDIDLTWEVVYDSGFLPGQERIMSSGQ